MPGYGLSQGATQIITGLPAASVKNHLAQRLEPSRRKRFNASGVVRGGALASPLELEKQIVIPRGALVLEALGLKPGSKIGNRLDFDDGYRGFHGLVGIRSCRC